MKLIHLADSHLNESNNFQDTINCLNQVIAWAHKYEAAFTLIAGNLFDRVKPTPQEYLIAESFLYELSNQSTIILVSGDKMHEQSISPEGTSAIDPLKLVSRQLFHPYISSKTRIIKNELEANFYLVPTPYRSILLADEKIKDLSSEEINAILTQKMKEIIWGFKAEFDKDRFNILVAHGSILGCAYNETTDVGLSDIFIDPDDLDGFDYIAMGHLHVGQRVRDNCYYSGSLNRINFSEEHLNPHALLVDLEKGKKPKVTELYTPATKYKTFSSIEEIMGIENSDLDPDTHYRVKGEIREEDLPMFKAKMNGLSVPIKSAITVLSSDYVRSEALTHDLGLEASLLEYITLNPEYTDLQSDLINKALELEKELE
jgi:exonuclease SbcD